MVFWKKVDMGLALPMIWREQRDHITDCQGYRNPGEGGWGDISPPMIWVWSTSAYLPIIWLWCASERRSPTDFGEKSVQFSSVARGGSGGGGYSPFFIGPSNKMQNKENTTFLSFLKLLFVLEWTKKWFKAFFETYIQGGGLICQN